MKARLACDFLGDGVDQETCIYQGLAGARAPDGALGQIHERFAAGSLAVDATFNLANKGNGVFDSPLPARQCHPDTGITGPLRTGLIPVSESLTISTRNFFYQTASITLFIV